MLRWFRRPGSKRPVLAAIAALLLLFLTGPLTSQSTGDEPRIPRESRPAARSPIEPAIDFDQPLTWPIDEDASTPDEWFPFTSAYFDEPPDDAVSVERLLFQEPEAMVPESLPPINDDTAEVYSTGEGAPVGSEVFGRPSYPITYDRGFRFRPDNPDVPLFELKIRTQNQIRYTGFARDARTWTDGAGVVRPVTNVSNFQIPRGRLIFSGFIFLRDLSYNLNIDYNTVSANQINFRAYWLAWRFNRAVTAYIGQSKVPGSREWLLSIMNTLGPDRSMATTFFRPSLSQGLWFTGEPLDGLFYHAMMSNGFNTLGATSQQLNSRMTFSGSLWWEPWGEFGLGYSDFEWHEAPSLRGGFSLTHSPEQGPQGSPDAPENADVRLSNGTLLTATGALDPGATLNLYKIGLASIDLAYKYRGLGLSGEYFLQNIFGLGANMPLPQSSIFQQGGFIQGGYFFIPEKLEVYGRSSYARSTFGFGSEYAGGFNWFFLPGKQNLRFTLDAAWLNHNPADQNRTNLQAGQTGLLVRSQVQLFF
ncbi:MAG: porin [Planctomycetales bacterium]